MGPFRSPRRAALAPAAVRGAIADEGVPTSSATLGASPIGDTPQAFAGMVREETDRLPAPVARFPIR